MDLILMFGGTEDSRSQLAEGCHYSFMRFLVCLGWLAATPLFSADLRVGIIGTDTSHVPAFTKLLNDAAAPGHVPGARVVAAWKGGSPDIESSRTRVDGFAEEIRTKYGVEIVPDIPTLLSKVDVVLIESVEGRPHLAQARPVIAAHKPLFIDKPLTSTLEDAREIARLASEAGVPWFSSSSLRFSDWVAKLRSPDNSGAIVWGPARSKSITSWNSPGTRFIPSRCSLRSSAPDARR